MTTSTLVICKSCWRQWHRLTFLPPMPNCPHCGGPLVIDVKPELPPVRRPTQERQTALPME